jgi:hypothetical protein
MDGCSMSKYDEQYKLYFKASFDAINHATTRAEDAYQSYAALLDKFNRYVVISDEIDGRQSQLVKISTTFGTEDPSDPNIKEFTFNTGSVLRYSRILPATHNDNLEVVNFQTLMNVIYNNSSNVTQLLSQYLSKYGDLAFGSYTFGIDPGGSSSQAITLDTIPLKVLNAETTLETGTLKTVTSNPLSLINKQYADATYAQGLGAANQPVFVSGKIAIHSTLNQSTIRSFGKYDVVTGTGGDTNYIKIKLLKYNAKTSWDSTDKSWVELFGSEPQNSIPGFDTGTAIGRIPYPVDFTLYVEYEPPATTFPYLLINNSSRVRAALSNSIGSTYNGGYVEQFVIIDSDGDLCLILETDYQIDIPLSTSLMSLNCNSSYKPLLYLVVNRWSYIPKNNPYIDQVGTVSLNPVLLFTDQTWMRGATDTGVITVRYRLLYANITGSITWSSDKDVLLGITYGQDASGYYADIAFPVGETIYTVTFSANYGSTLTKSVNLQLKNYVLSPITSISPLTITRSRWDGSPDPLAISTTVTAVGGGTKTWSILPTDETLGTTTLISAAINPTTGVLTGNYSVADVDLFAIVSVTDGTSTYKDKITIHVDELSSGGGGGSTDVCFSCNTFVLTTRGGIKINELTLNDICINLNLDMFSIGRFELAEGQIHEIAHHHPHVSLINIHGIDTTINHPFGLANGLWKEASTITTDEYLVKLVEPATIIKDAFEGSRESDYVGEVWNIHLHGLNYFVSNNENGPWYLVHNNILVTKS